MQKVLVADDEPGMRALVRATLESDRYEVLEAVDGDEAWTLIEAERPDLVVLDVQMPGKSGLELVKGIRMDPALRATKVVLLTAFRGAADVEAGMNAGADFYLTKPYSPIELQQLIDRALGPE
jgi:CheY-like chemotaxis protein